MTTGDLTISSYLDNDIPSLVALINSAYRGEGSKKGWTTEADLLLGPLRIDEETLSKTLHKDGATMLKITKDTGEILGCVYLAEQSGKLYLGMLTVSPELQSTGIGKKLLFAAEEHAKKINLHAITMQVVSVRDELISWYIRHGYHDTGERRPFPTDNNFGVPTQALEFAILEKIVDSK